MVILKQAESKEELYSKPGVLRWDLGGAPKGHVGLCVD